MSCASFDFATARPLSELLDWSIAMLEHGVTHQTHPRYFGLFNPAPTFPAQCADRIVSSFNPQLASSTTSPAAVALEAHVIRSVAQRVPASRQARAATSPRAGPRQITPACCARLRAHIRVRVRRCARFPGAAGLLYLEGVPPQLGEDRASGGHRPLRRAPGGYRRPRPHVTARRSSRRSRTILPAAACPSYRRHCGNDQRRHDRSSDCLRRTRRTPRALVPR